MALALTVPLSVACGDSDSPETPTPAHTQADAGGPDGSPATSPDGAVACDGGLCDGGAVSDPSDGGSGDAGGGDGGLGEDSGEDSDGGTGDAGSHVPPLPVDLKAPPELLVRSGGSAALRVEVERLEGFSGPMSLSVRGLPSEVFVADRWVSEDTSAVALVVSVSDHVGSGTRIDATLEATADGRSTSRPLRLLVSGPSFALDPTFPVVPFSWTDTSRSFASQADGKVLTAHAIAPGSWGTGQGFVLERHHADGAPDLSFGMLGTATHRHPPVKQVLALTALPTGGSLVLGTASDCHDEQSSTPCTLLVSRHLAMGELDPTFGEGGVASARFSAMPRSRVKLLVDEAGRVSVAMSYFASTPEGSLFYGVQRWEADGQPVAGFGTEGNVTFPLPSGESRFDQLEAAQQREDGTVVIAVSLFDRNDSKDHGLAFALVDGASGQASWAINNSPGQLHRGVFTDGHGRFVSLVSTYAPTYDVIVQWYSETGSRIYTGSSTMPARLLAIGSANELFFDDAGTPFTVGEVEGGGGLAVVRFTRQGTVDPGFGSNGLVRLDSRRTSLSGFIREPNGCLLARTYPEPGLVRLWP